MEKFALEIVETINEHYYRDGTDGKELIKDMLFYLYHTTNDDKMKQVILDWFNKEQYCIECGAKLQPYDYCEAWLCPVCDRGEFEYYGYAE